VVVAVKSGFHITTNCLRSCLSQSVCDCLQPPPIYKQFTTCLFSESQEQTWQQRYTFVSYNSIHSRHFSDTGQRIVCAKTLFLVNSCYWQPVTQLLCLFPLHLQCHKNWKVKPLPTLPVAAALLLHYVSIIIYMSPSMVSGNVQLVCSYMDTSLKIFIEKKKFFF